MQINIPSGSSFITLPVIKSDSLVLVILAGFIDSVIWRNASG